MSSAVSEGTAGRSQSLLSGLFAPRQVAPAQISPADGTMLGFFKSTLLVRIEAFRAKIANDAAKSTFLDGIADEVRSISTLIPSAEGEAAWTKAYRLERLLTLVEPADNLAREVQRRVDEAFDENVAVAPRLQTKLDAAKKEVMDASQTPPALRPEGEPILRMLLLDVLEEIHWNAQKKFCVRPIQRIACHRIIWFEIFAFVAVIAPYMWLYFYIHSTHKSPSFEHWSWLPLYTALTAGLFGAFFSRLQSLQTDWNNLSIGQAHDARDFRSISLRGAVGMGGALVVYFFLQSGIVSGGLFPKFNELGLSQLWFTPPPPSVGAIHPVSAIQLIQPDLSLALLVIWSFVAGFSERLVPGILAATDTSLSNAANGQRK